MRGWCRHRRGRDDDEGRILLVTAKSAPSAAALAALSSGSVVNSITGIPEVVANRADRLRPRAALDAPDSWL